MRGRQGWSYYEDDEHYPNQDIGHPRACLRVHPAYRWRGSRCVGGASGNPFV